ncbi:cmgc/cdk/pitslre protein kinase Ppk23 [Schizosaccharomyces japonicus yFS275]|uniref:cyclin-dependent kinase n=1 Tax=Schizosaccharomyces japonicus (strain yFS275 / FY16936) TaxID=402676 RepID=B6K468_SCHJY|nr:cmgc/cdk/pitslre protein kinase Ppk23 [Schizosaccharomyces japonicus yFS275]EEB08275.1 cmgc/cdk/pitslre protein kinase Ppk23 [Schizosaccharomyces japonicus yFS275]
MTSKWERIKDNDGFAAEDVRREQEWRKRRKLEKQKKQAELLHKESYSSFDVRSFILNQSGQLHSCDSIDSYEVLNKIEEGSYGIVYRARDKRNKNIIALKKVKLEKDYVEGFPITSLREIQSLKLVQHDNIVKLLDVVTGRSGKDVYLVMEFMEHDLATLLKDMPEDFLQSEVKTLMLQLLAAVATLHHHWFVHRDLKPSNLLMNNTGEIKIADFGLARSLGEPKPQLTRLVVTLWYRAPELLLGAPSYGKEIDMWSVGCIFAELLTRSPLFNGRSELDQLSKIFNFLGYPTHESWPQFFLLPHASQVKQPSVKSQHSQLRSAFPFLTAAGHDLLSRLLTLNPAHRITAEEALQHPYFTEAPRPKDPRFFPTFPSKAKGEHRKEWNRRSDEEYTHTQRPPN